MKILNKLIVTVVVCVSINAQEVDSSKIINHPNVTTNEAKPLYQGDVKEVLHSAGYTYLLINENSPGYDQKELKSFWIAVTRTEAKVGDYVRFKKELAMKNFKSKLLDKTFEEVMFASDLEYRVSK